MGLHHLKFGYFLTDLAHGDGGSLQVVRGSHLRPELDGRDKDFDIQSWRDELVRFDVPAGSIVAFHQAIWHAAFPNASDVERKNLYISYCPTWMKPLDQDLAGPGEAPCGLADLGPEARLILGGWRPPTRFWIPDEADLAGLSRYAGPHGG